MRRILPLIFLSAVFSLPLFAGGRRVEKILLWKDVPQMQKYKTVLYYHPPIPSAPEGKYAAVIICPGGSYHHLGLYNEGFASATWFAEKGVAAFTVRYRTAQCGFHAPAMLQDVQRAIQLVRENAEAYGIDEHKIGLIGYSAGGHLVTMAAAFHESHDELAALGIAHSASLRPDFVIPVYPVVTMRGELAHRWSQKSLLGKAQTAERQLEFSMEAQIHSDMPPTYIVACKDDRVVDYRNSVMLYEAAKAKNANVELKLYERGGHGFGMLSGTAFMRAFHWNEEMWRWLEAVLAER